MKPFDLEAAKRGELFVHEHAPDLKSRFIGFRSNGSIVYEELRAPRGANEISWAPAEALRMLPRKVERWVNIYRDLNGNLSLGDPYSTADLAGIARSGSGKAFVGTSRVEWEE